MVDEKEIISIEGILRVCRLAKKVAFFALIVIWTLVVLGGYKYKSTLACSIVGAIFSLLVLGFTLYHCRIEQCINKKRLEIRDDVVEDLEEVHKHESEDYYVTLRNAGKSVVLYIDYKDMKIKDKVYVFEYLNRSGKCIIKRIYLHKKYKISPELREFYIGSEEGGWSFYE